VSNFKFFDRYDETTQSGYFPFKTENAKDAKAKDLKEFFHFYERFPLPVGMSQATRRLHRELVAIGQEVLGWVEANVPEDVRAKFSERLVGMTENCDQHFAADPALSAARRNGRAGCRKGCGPHGHKPFDRLG
jgi:hypothetical protein